MTRLCTLKILAATLLLFTLPAAAFECTNAGAGGVPDDNGTAANTACGDGANAAGTGGTALGRDASASGTGSTALGREASASGANSSAMGVVAQAVGTFSVALGWGAEANGPESTALGYEANSILNNSTAVGRSASSGGSFSTAVGSFANSGGAASLALGGSASSAGTNSTAVGESTQSFGRNSTSLGYLSDAWGDNSTALGARATALNENTMVLGSIPGVNNGTAYVSVANGTADPLAPLHIFRDDVTQEFLFLESNEIGTVQDRAMMFLVNNGGIRFEFNNPVLGTAWRFQAATGNQDNFEIAKVGTGEIEFRVDADGNAYAAGLFFENSDRNAKTDIEAVDSEAILEKVVQLPIAEWAYKESPESRHIGPMAQDFHAAFQTGVKDTRLATMDGVGVAIASIQALEARNRELEREVEALQELKTRNADLEQRLELVENLLTQLLPRSAQN